MRLFGPDGRPRAPLGRDPIEVATGAELLRAFELSDLARGRGEPGRTEWFSVLLTASSRPLASAVLARVLPPVLSAPADPDARRAELGRIAQRLEDEHGCWAVHASFGVEGAH